MKPLAVRHAVLPLLFLLAACEAAPAAVLPATLDEAETDLKRMAANPKPLRRPVVILAGWSDPGILTSRLRTSIKDTCVDPQILELAFATELTFPACRRKVIDAVEARWPSGDPDETVEVDVIGHSMGGLVARFSAVPAGTEGFPEGRTPTGKRLKIARLFTLGTPHQGANIAYAAVLDPRGRDMLPGSDFLAALNERCHCPDCRQLVPYAIEADWIVGVSHTAPPDMEGRVIPARPGYMSHVAAPWDPRLRSDILRQLRGEPTWAEEREAQTAAKSKQAKAGS